MKLDRVLLFCGVAVLSLVLVCADTANAQGRGGRGGRGGFGAMGQQFQMMGLLRDDKVAKDLDLSDDQLQQFEDLQQDMRDSMRDMFRDLRDMNEEERTDAVKRYMDDFKREVDGILLPHQAKRLSQLTLQSSMRSNRGRNGGALALLQNEELKEKLGITEEQVEDMQKKSEQVNEELQKKIARMQEEAKEEVLSVLSRSQRTKLKEMLGDTFEFSNNRGRFGQGGGRGGNNGGGRGGRDDGGRDDG